MSSEEYQQFLSEHGEEIDLQSTINQARNTAKKLLIQQRMLGNPNMTQEQRKKLEATSEAITAKYLDELASTMNVRLEGLGKHVRASYEILIKDTERGTSAMENRLKGLAGFTDKDRATLEGILRHFCILDEGEKGKSFLSRWMHRDAMDGRLVAEDYAALQRIHAPEGSKEKAFLDQLNRNLAELKNIDPQNLTFAKSTPSVSPGGKFVLSLLLGGIALLSFLVSRKTKRLPKKGLIALGLLYFLHRNPESKLSFLSSPEYERLTAKLRGKPAGQGLIESLGNRNNRRELLKFAKREQQRQTLPAAARGNLPDANTSLQDLSDALGLKKDEKALLASMPTQDIILLATTLQKFSTEELDKTATFVGEGVTKGDLGDVKLEKADTKGS